MIALYHKHSTTRAVWLATEANIDWLFDKIQRGDTMHNVDVADDKHVPELWEQLDSQRREGKCKLL